MQDQDKLFTATEARKIAESAGDRLMKKQLTDTLDQIKIRSQAGFTFVFAQQLNDYTQEELTKLGYIVTYETTINFPSYKVSWA